MVVILFAAFSMAATIVAIFRHEADLERPLSHVGIEGMMMISVCVMTLHDRVRVNSLFQFFFVYRGERLFYLFHWSFWLLEELKLYVTHCYYLLPC